ncbi:MAG: EamA family transporter [Patescibacteria group bacterium]
MFVLALPLLAAITDAGSLILSKLFLRRFGRLTFREFNWLAFLGIVTVLVILSILLDQFPTKQMIFDNWPQILGLAGLGTFANVLFFRGLEGESVSNVEPFIIFKPLAAILIASLAFPAERSTIIYFAIIASALILAWAHLSNKRIKLSPELLSIMGFWGVYGVELIFVNNLLSVFRQLNCI